MEERLARPSRYMARVTHATEGRQLQERPRTRKCNMCVPGFKISAEIGILVTCLCAKVSERWCTHKVHLPTKIYSSRGTLVSYNQKQLV